MSARACLLSGAVQCSAVRCSAVRCGAVRCGAVRCCVALRCVVWLGVSHGSLYLSPNAAMQSGPPLPAPAPAVDPLPQVISKGVCVGVQGLTVIDSFSDQPDVVDTLNSLPDLRFLYAGWDGWNPPEWRERWAALFPRSQHHVYPGVRHGVVTAETGAVFIGEGLAKHVASLGLACQR